MIELLYSSLIIFAIIFPTIFILNSFKMMKLLIIFVQFNINIFYKTFPFDYHKFSDYELFKELPFEPINNISFFKHSLNVEYLNDTSYSLIKKGKFSKECLPNFYINELYECPITNIFLGNNKSINEEGYTTIKINKDDYIYYNKNNIAGKFHEKIYYSSYSKYLSLYGYYFSCENILKEKYISDYQISNPFINYYNYIKNNYYLEILLCVILFIYNLIESHHPKVFNYFKIIGYFFEIIVLIIGLYEFNLFIKSKHFILNKDNKEILDLLVMIFLDIKNHSI